MPETSQFPELSASEDRVLPPQRRVIMIIPKMAFYLLKIMFGFQELWGPPEN